MQKRLFVAYAIFFPLEGRFGREREDESWKRCYTFQFAVALGSNEASNFFNSSSFGSLVISMAPEASAAIFETKEVGAVVSALANSANFSSIALIANKRRRSAVGSLSVGITGRSVAGTVVTMLELLVEEGKEEAETDTDAAADELRDEEEED